MSHARIIFLKLWLLGPKQALYSSGREEIMADLLHDIDQRTQMAGENRLELLLFRLGTSQRFGINVFKIREVVTCPSLMKMPGASPAVCGVARVRESNFPVIDLSSAIGGTPLSNPEDGFLMIAEFNRSVQGLLVSTVDQIINVNWEAIQPPPPGLGEANYLTAITQVDEDLVEIIDVEKVFSEIIGVNEGISETVLDEVTVSDGSAQHALVVDDSLVARNQIARTLEQMGVAYELAKDGREALGLLRAWVEEGRLDKKVGLVISDIEMPEMDGYTLCDRIKTDPALGKLHVLLHSSLSGAFNEAMIRKVGADKFLPKFSPDELAGAVRTCFDAIFGVSGDAS